jgi:galactokinase
VERRATLIDVATLREVFRKLYKSDPRIFRAPGRVNLIGEHTDYNEGFVLPMAINHDAVVAASPRSDRLVRIRSIDFGETLEFDLDHPGPKRRGIWLDYVEGVAQMLIEQGVQLVGANLALQSDVPVGSGLSSSAAIEIASGFALWSIAGGKVDLVQLAVAGQKAEHEYVGANVGIMDQLTAATGRAGHALLIDCRSLDRELIPLDSSDTEIVICDSRVKHALASSAYNTRRQECEQGVELLRKVLPDIKALRDVSVEQFTRYQDLLPEPVNRRVRHVVTEDARTLQAADALRRNDFPLMGRLMFESHLSLRDDYEVSSVELDTLVEIASEVDGVYGARMTGGGFGGCTVNLVRKEAIGVLEERISARYLEATGKVPLIYVSEACDGASEIA